MSKPSSRAPVGPVDGGARHCGFIAVIGAPNAGKSTLVNALVGAKVTIVSHKVQTTRVPVRGIAIAGPSQLVFVDTPGMHGASLGLVRRRSLAARPTGHVKGGLYGSSLEFLWAHGGCHRSHGLRR
jgi:ribosome biogenesis GTPase A